MQELGVVRRLFPEILSGKKRSTIRWRELRVTLGYLRYICNDDPRQTVIVWVIKCTDIPLSKAAAFVGRAEEWPKSIMLASMREHYPDIQWDDEVQVVEHLTPAESRTRLDYPG